VTFSTYWSLAGVRAADGPSSALTFLKAAFVLASVFLFGRLHCVCGLYELSSVDQ
jgi:hypothetical protein